jgi:hypothetical protein
VLYNIIKTYVSEKGNANGASFEQISELPPIPADCNKETNIFMCHSNPNNIFLTATMQVQTCPNLDHFLL